MDALLKEFFKQERWESAIDTAADKHICKTELRKLCLSDVRYEVFALIEQEIYRIAPPRTALIPKEDKNEYRTVYINENIDRVILSILNDMLIELCAEMIHPACKSYQPGTGCNAVVKELSERLAANNHKIIGFKADLSKYFDSVPIRFIDEVFDKVERKFGHSAIITLARKYYHQDLYFDEEGNLQTKYQSLKQGCALASFLADALLYDLDDAMSKLPGFYVRYSDDILYIGDNYMSAKNILVKHLQAKELTLNPKKFELLTHDKWFKFLGYNIKANSDGTVLRTLSKSRVKKFQKEIEHLTIKSPNTRMKRAINQVNNFLYKGEYPWATSVLTVMNVDKDIDTLNQFVMDCIRACATQKKKVGGLGVVMDKDDFTILRGTGKNVTANRQKTPKELDGYKSLDCMRNVLLITRPLYDTIVRQM